MANETLYTDVSSYLPDIWEGVLMFLEEQFFMPSLVTTFMDQTGMQARKVTEYSAGTVSTGLGETDDLANERQNVTRSLLATLTPAEIGTQYLITDRRIDSDDTQIVPDVIRHIGYAVGQQVEQDLISNFSSFTAGTIDNTAGTLTWRNVYDARSLLAATAVPGPYSLVLHEYQWMDLANEATIVGISNPGPLRIRDEIQSQYYVGSIGDINLFVTGNQAITAGTAVNAGMFARAAIAFDVRRGLRIEPERDASLRSSELNASMIYAHGVWRADHGVTIISDASAPS